MRIPRELPIAGVAAVSLVFGVTGVLAAVVLDGPSASMKFGLVAGGPTATRSVTYTSGTPLPSPLKLELAKSDLPAATGDAVFPAANITASVAPAGPTLVGISVALSPSGVKAGAYSGALRLVGPDVTDINLALTANVRDDQPLLALIVIVLGGIAGWVAKYFSDTAIPLRDQWRRFEPIRDRFRPLRPFLPRAFGDWIDQVARLLGWGDHAAAKAEIDTIEPKLPKLYAIGEQLRDVEASLVMQRTIAARLAPPAASWPAVENAELLEVERLRDGAWQDPEGGGEDRTELVSAARLVRLLLELFERDPASRPRVLEAFDDYVRKSLKEGNEKARAVLGGSRALAAVSGAPTGISSTAPAMPGWIKRSGMILQGITLALVTVIAFNVLYLTPVTFGDQGLASYIALAFAAFAAQISGVTLAQVAAKAPSAIG